MNRTPQPNASAYAIRGLVVSFGLLVQWMLSEQIVSPAVGLIVNSLLLMAYLTFEIRNLRVTQQRLLLANSVVLASILTFIIPFGLSNVMFFLPDDLLAQVSLGGRVSPSMNDLMWLVLLAACSMWVGYDSLVSRAIGERLASSRLLGHLLSPVARANRLALLLCVALSVTARIIEADWGVLGFSAMSDRSASLVPYREFLTIIDLLGRWALIAMALEYFGSPSPTPRQRLWLALLLTWETTAGFLTGYKSMVLFPIGMVALAHYVQRGSVPRWTAPALIGALLTAYTVVEPYRALFREGNVQTDISSVAAAMFDAPRDATLVTEVPVTLQIGARLNLTYVASIGVEYTASGAPLPNDSPEFLTDIFWAPAYAAVPRLLWDSKPLNDGGLWYTRQMLGLDYQSSTGMSAVTYLNFAGGALAVILGFLFVGFSQRVLWIGLRAFGAGGWMVWLGVLPQLSQVESAFAIQLAGVLRLLPLLVLIQYLLLAGPRASSQEARASRGNDGYVKPQRHVVALRAPSRLA